MYTVCSILCHIHFLLSDQSLDYLQFHEDFTAPLTPVVSDTRATEISISGNALVQHYIDILSNVTFVSLADEPGYTNRTVLFELVDERGFSFSASTLVVIVPTNDPTVFSFNNSVIIFNETARIPVNLLRANDTLIDPDSSHLQWLTVEIRPSINVMDALFADPENSNLQIDTSTSTNNNFLLTITGFANFSVYQTVLQTLTFYNPFPGINLTNRSIHLVTFNGETVSPPTIVNVHIDSFDDVAVCHFASSMVCCV